MRVIAVFVVAVFVGLVGFIIWRSQEAIVGVGEVGIVKHWDGKITEIQTGMQSVGFGVSVDKLPISLQVDSQSDTIGTSDNQELPVSYTLKYYLDDSDAALLYRTTGGRDITYIQNNIVNNDLQGFLTLQGHQHDYSDFKSSTLQTITDEITSKISSDLQQDGIKVEGFKFTRIGTPAGMQASQKQLAQAEAQRQISQQQQDTAKIENQTKILNAQAQAQADQIQAQANDKLSNSYSQLMVEMELAKKWDGHSWPSTVMSGSGSNGSGSPFALFNVPAAK